MELELTDKDRLLDVLLLEKSLASSYGVAALESANSHLREALLGMARDEQDLHTRVFHEAHRRGWYSTRVTGDQAIDTTLNTWQSRIDREPALKGLPS